MNAFPLTSHRATGAKPRNEEKEKTMLERISATLTHLRANFKPRAGWPVLALLAALVLCGPATPTFAQARASTLSPSRDSAPPGATLNISVSPALAAPQPAGSHLVLRSAQGRRGAADMELRIVDWRGEAIRATVPRDASVTAGAMRLVLLDRRNEVIAHSGNQLFRVVAAGEVPSEGRTAGAGAGSPVDVPGEGPAARVPGSPGPQAGNHRERPDRRAGTTAPDVANAVPGADPRTDREVQPRSGAITTPGILGQAREPDVSAGGAATRGSGARSTNRVAADFVVIGDESRTIPGGKRAAFSFDLPADAQPTGRAVLFYVVNPDAPPGGVNASVAVYLNGREIWTHSYSDGMVRTMFETLDANRTLRPGANSLEFRANGNPTKVSDIVLMYHRLDDADAPPPPAKSARTRELPPVVSR